MVRWLGGVSDKYGTEKYPVTLVKKKKKYRKETQRGTKYTVQNVMEEEEDQINGAYVR